MSYRTRDKVLLARVHTDATEPAITGADAIAVGNLRYKANVAMVQTNYHRATTNKSVDEAGASYAEMSFTRLLTGSGTAGTAPREDILLRASGLKPTVIAGVAALAVTAGSAQGVTLSVDSPVLAANPRGLVVVVSAGTGAGQRRVVTGYSSGTKVASVAGAWDTPLDNTSKIDILQGTLYTPLLDTYEQIGLWEVDRNKINTAKSRRSRALRAMTTWSGKISTGNPMELSYTARGMMPSDPDDIAWPAPISYGTQASTAPKLLAAEVFLGGARLRFSELTFDLAATLDQPDNPAEARGFDGAEVMEHATGGRFVPERLDLTQRNLMTDFRAGTPRDLALCWGIPGNGFSLLAEIKYSGAPEEQDVRGRIGDAVPYRAHRETDWFHLFAF